MKYVSLNWNLIKSKGLQRKYSIDVEEGKTLITEKGVEFYKVALDPDSSEPIIIVTITDKEKFLNFIAENDLTFKTLEEGMPELGDGVCMEEAIKNWNL